jgi:hypothetical protein
MQIQQIKFQILLLNPLKRQTVPFQEAKSNTNSTANGGAQITNGTADMLPKAAVNRSEKDFIKFFQNVQNVQSLALNRFQDVKKVCEKYNLDYSKPFENGLAKVFAEISKGDLGDSADDHFSNAENLLINELGFTKGDAVNFVFNQRIGLRYESGTW